MNPSIWKNMQMKQLQCPTYNYMSGIRSKYIATGHVVKILELYNHFNVPGLKSTLIHR